MMNMDSLMPLSRLLNQARMLSGPLDHAAVRLLLDETPIAQAVRIRKELSCGPLPESLQMLSQAERLYMGAFANLKIVDDFLTEQTRLGVSYVQISEALFQQMASAVRDVYQDLDEKDRAVCDDFLSSGDADQSEAEQAPRTTCAPFTTETAAMLPHKRKVSILQLLSLLAAVLIPLYIDSKQAEQDDKIMQIVDQIYEQVEDEAKCSRHQSLLEQGKRYEEQGDLEKAKEFYAMADRLANEILYDCLEDLTDP